MKRTATALHLVEKGLVKNRLQRIHGKTNEWLTGNWWVADDTAKQLVGKKIYLHRGQNKASHIGGEILGFEKATDSDGKRKVFRFRELKKCTAVLASEVCWGNEKGIVWT